MQSIIARRFSVDNLDNGARGRAIIDGKRGGLEALQVDGQANLRKGPTSRRSNRGGITKSQGLKEILDSR